MIRTWDEVQTMPERVRDWIIERAALIEDGEPVTREQAEQMALEQWNKGER